MTSAGIRVGFAWDNPPETLGGGPAFGREILRMIHHMRSQCPHQLFMITQKEPDPNIGNWHWLKASAPCRRGGFGPRLGKLFRRLLSRDIPASLPPTGWRCHGRPLEEAIDALFFLYPDCYEGLDIFQVSTIWDLSHRYVPFFPEIGNFQERDRRENLFAKVVRNASFLITGTERSKDELENYYGWEKSLVRLIPHPTPTSAMEFGRQAKKKNQGPAYALYPAQFWPHKNHLVLLQAWKILSEGDLKNFKLVFTGSDQGNEAYIRRQVAEWGLTSQVEFRGFVPKQELLQLYVDATMMVYPSLFGPENLPPLEAFALGCPVLAADVPGSEEQLGDAALRLPPRNPQAWADAVASFRKNPDLRAELVAQGKKRAERTTTETFALGLFSLMDEIADLRGLWPKGRLPLGVTSYVTGSGEKRQQRKSGFWGR
jgi:glycosyltransferase involved in cell wall biosynthesis